MKYTFGAIERVAMLEHYKRRHIRDSTKAFYRGLERRVLDAFGNYDIRTITIADIQGFLDCEADKAGRYVSRRTVTAWLTILHLTFNYAAKYGLIVKNPMQSEAEDLIFPEVLPAPNPDDRFLSKDQLKQVLHAVAENDLYATLTQTLLVSGMRIGELLALRRSDLCPERNMVRIRHSITKVVDEQSQKIKFVVGDTKTRASNRNSYVSPIFFALIRRWLQVMKADNRLAFAREKGNSGYIFLNKDGNTFNYATLQHNFRKYLRSHGISFRVTFHMFRHCYVSYMVCGENGLKLEDISRQIGHRSIKTTYDIYFSQTDQAQRKLIAAGTEAFHYLML